MPETKFIRLTPNELDILHILFADPRDVYGLAIFKRINKVRTSGDFNFGKIGYGSFYAALKKLEREGLITSSAPEEDKRKKYYGITNLGSKLLQVNVQFIQSINSREALIQ